MNKLNISIFSKRPIVAEGFKSIFFPYYFIYYVNKISPDTLPNSDILIIDDAYLDKVDIIKIIDNLSVWGFLDRVLIYTASKEAFYLQSLFSKNIKNIIHETAPLEKVGEAVALLFHKKVCIDDYDNSTSFSERISFEVNELLSKREKEILSLIAKGVKNKQIASTLFISPGTVEVHKSNIIKKLKLRSTSQLSIIANQITKEIQIKL